MGKKICKLCAATTVAAMLMSVAPIATPVAHAGWGSVIGGVIGGILNGGGSSGGSSGGGNGGQRNSGPAHQEHARKNMTDNEKLFIVAIKNNDIAVVKSMIDAGVDINGVFSAPQIANTIHAYMGHNYSPLEVALFNKHYDIVQLLLENGADVSGFYDYDGRHFSYVEMTAHHLLGMEFMQLLLAWGADINGTSEYSEGIKVNALSSLVSNYLHLAPAKEAMYEMITFLMNNGIDPENHIDADFSRDLTPFLFVASSTNAFNSYRIDSEALWRLANGGCDIYACDGNGKNALQRALDSGDYENYKTVEEVFTRGQQPSQYQPSKPQTQRRASESGGNTSSDDELILIENNTDQKANIQELNKVFDILIQASKDETNAYNEFNSYTSKLDMKNITVADRSIPSQKMVDAMKRIQEATNPQKILAGMEHCTLDEKDVFGDLLQIMSTRYEKVIGYFSILATERDLTSTEKQQVKSMMAESQSLQKSIDDMWNRITKMYNR